MDNERYVQAWSLKPGDKIHEPISDNATALREVLEVFQATQHTQGQSTAVTVAVRGSYSPSWRVYHSNETVKITERG